MLLALKGLDFHAACHDVATAEVGGAGRDCIPARRQLVSIRRSLIWTIIRPERQA